MLFSLLVLTGCASARIGTPTETATPTTAATSESKQGNSPSETPTPISTAVTSIPAASPNPNATSQAAANTSSALSISNIQMLTSTQGWAIGLAVGGGDSVLITTDSGTHWQDVTPPGVSATTFTSYYFLDTSRAWLAIPTADGASISIYSTSDGGQSWQSGTPIELPNGGAGSLDFVDSQYGWFFVSLGAAQGSEAVELFRTTDGGMNWEIVSLTSGDAAQSTSGSLPFTCTKTGISFMNDSLGWAAGSCSSGPLFFYQSRNTGITWQAQTPPPPAGYPQDLFSNCNCSTTKPEFISPQDGHFLLIVSGKLSAAFLYVTNDGGTTWNPYPLPTNTPLGQPDFIDQSTGFVTDGKLLYVSQDGGQDWNQVAKFPTDKLQSGLNFVNGKDGWFTADSTLYVTHDGGQTWSKIKALMAPILIPQVVQVIQIQPGSMASTFTANLTAGTSQGFSLQLQAQQNLYIIKNGEARLEVVDAQNHPILTSTSLPGPLKVDIANTGTYTIILEGEKKTTVSIYFPIPGNSSQVPIPLPSMYQHIGFYPGTSNAAIALNLASGTPMGYILTAQKGQQINLNSNGDITLAVLDTKNNVLPMVTPDLGVWQVPIPANGDYKLILQGVGQTTLTISIPGLNSSASANSVLPATRTRLTIPAGENSTTITTTLTSGVPQGFVLYVQQNQRMYVVASSDTITATLLDPSNQPLNSDHAAESDLWSAGISSAGDYTLVVAGQGNVNLTVYVSTPGQQPAGAITPPSKTTPINLPSGNASTTFSASLLAQQPQGYLLKLQKGQQLYITASGDASVGVLDTSGSALAIDHPANSEIWSLAIPQTGSYTVVISGNGNTTVTVFSPPLSSAPAAQPVPAPYKLTNINIPKGDQGIALSVILQSNRALGYIVQVAKGEQLNVSVTNGINVGILGPDGTVENANHSSGSELWSLSAPSTGSYTVVLFGSGSTTLTIAILPAQP